MPTVMLYSLLYTYSTWQRKILFKMKVKKRGKIYIIIIFFLLILSVWFQGIDALPKEVTGLMRMAVTVPPVARAVVSGALAALGVIILIGAMICLARAAKRQEKLHLSSPLPSNPSSNNKNGLNPNFQNPSRPK